VVLDLFNFEQALSLILGEFLQQLNSGTYPELLAMVIYKVCYDYNTIDIDIFII
jgi:hypothetical protein